MVVLLRAVSVKTGRWSRIDGRKRSWLEALVSVGEEEAVEGKRGKIRWERKKQQSVAFSFVWLSRDASLILFSFAC